MNRGSRPMQDSDLGSQSGFNEAPIHESGKYMQAKPKPTPKPRFNEAPIHESGKSLAVLLPGQHIRLASMRPRFMNRGSWLRTVQLRLRSLRFNEAPIHESGKFAPLADSLSTNTGFNEAPIHESGKLPACPGLTAGALFASMRPRFMNRGSHVGARVGRRAFRRFNEAPIHESGKSP